MGGVSAVDAAVDALLPPVGHLELHPFTRTPPAVLGRPFGVFLGPLRNGVAIAWWYSSVERHDRPPVPWVGGHRLPELSRARDTSPPSRRRR